MRILYDSKKSKYKTPFGALRAGEECRITIHIPSSCLTCVTDLIISPDNGGDDLVFGAEKEGTDGCYDFFTVRFRISTPGLYFYHFRIRTRNEEFGLYRYGYDDTNIEDGERWQLTCYPSDYKAPKGFTGVMYQIFPDRFAISGKPDLTEKMLPFSVHGSLSDIPEWEPDAKGIVKNCDFFGGNLLGITEKLPYLSSLGAEIIYLNPIFKAWSNHRYDTADYKKIDEMLGTEEDFKTLCREAHARGMKIILDGVFSHTGSRSVYFDEEGEFGNGAVSNPDSPYRDWFDFQHYPDTYTSWWGIRTLPCVNELNESYLDYIIRDDDSVIAHWLRAGADGFRLDVADELPDAFIALLRKRMKEIKPDSFLIGEVWEDASNKISYNKRRRYFSDGELDSVMNYPFRNAVLDFVTGRDNGGNFKRTVMTIAENYPPEVLIHLMNMMSTHDTPRLISALSPDAAPAEKRLRAGYRMGNDSRCEAEKRLLASVFLQFVLPGLPCVFYGDETGTEGYEDPFCRPFFDWSRTEGNSIAEFIKKLAEIRRSSDALLSGSVEVECPGENIVTVKRVCGSEIMTAVVNCGSVFDFTVDGSPIIIRNGESFQNVIHLNKYGFALVEK